MDERSNTSRPFYYLYKEPVKRFAHQPLVMPLDSSDRQYVAFEGFDDTIFAKRNGHQIMSQVFDCLMMRTIDHTRFETDDAGKT